MSQSPSSLIALLAVIAHAFALCETGAAQTARSDRQALSDIFAEQHVRNSAWDVHQRAMRMADEQRYEFLREWTLPGTNHDSLRMQYAFSPTNPVTETALERFDNRPEEDEPRTCRRPSGGTLVSPVYDLIDTAAKLGRLGELRAGVGPPVDENSDDPDRSALLILLDIAAEDWAAAVPRLERFSEAARQGAVEKRGPTAAELLVFTRAVESPIAREILMEVLPSYLTWMRSEFHRTVLKRHVAALIARLQVLSRQGTKEATETLEAMPLRQWFPVSRTTAATRGAGYPPARWDHRPGYVENTASHDDDYLYFAIPLGGNYDVECDVTGFEWRDSHLMVGGTWVAPVYTHSGYDLGYFRRAMPRVEFEPRLMKTTTWLHYRTIVRDGEATTFINGHKIHTESLRPAHEPWLAIRSSPRQDGAVRNLRITGNPVIPDVLNLSDDEHLDGWLPYYDGTSNPGVHWFYNRETPEGGGELLGYGSPVAAATVAAGNDQIHGYRENLLRYHRPLFEDGTIEYEFRYDPDQENVHPALDRLAFLLEPDGVQVHYVTDGRFDRTHLNPANVVDEPTNRRGPSPLPLQPGAWNQMSLSVTGDTLTLALNGQAIYERVLEPTNQRTFGLFHFADRSLARVRNVVWKGNWPRELPRVDEQELAAPPAEFPDLSSERLTAVFDHDFATSGLPQERFTIVRGDPMVHLQTTPDGLLATREGTGDYRNATVAPDLIVKGDFDIIAEYERFESNPVEEGSSLMSLMAILDNATSDESTMIRRHNRYQDGTFKQIVQCVEVRRIPERDRRTFFGEVPAEEHAGRLRLSRRGDQMYYLTAEYDSPHFQLRGQRTVVADDVRNDGIRLLVQTQNVGGDTSVIWKRLTVRAEQLSGRAVENTKVALKTLNLQRDALPERFLHTFADQAPSDELFRLWNNAQSEKVEQGWMIVAPGAPTWTSAGGALLKEVAGDFDIATHFDVVKADPPEEGRRVAVYLQIELADESESQVSLIFTLNSDGRTEILSQIREPSPNGSYVYRPLGGLDLPSVTSMRIARRGRRLTWLVSSESLSNDAIVAEMDVSDSTIPQGNVRFLVHTGNDEGDSRVVWKSLDVRAERISPETPPSLPDETPLRRGGLIESSLDLFR